MGIIRKKIVIDLKNAPRHLTLYDKHKYYVSILNDLDANNNNLRLLITTLSSKTTIKKDTYFLKNIKIFKEQLDKGLQIREQCRLRIRRLKETIKNKNRADNNNYKDFR